MSASARGRVQEGIRIVSVAAAARAASGPGIVAGRLRFVAGGDELARATAAFVREAPGTLTMELRQIDDPEIVGALTHRLTTAHPQRSMRLLVDGHHYDRAGKHGTGYYPLANGRHEWTAFVDRQHLRALRRQGAHVQVYASGTRVNGDVLFAHGKAVVARSRNGASGLLKTGTEYRPTRHKADLGVWLPRAHARMAGQLTDETIRASRTGDTKRLEALVQRVSRHGLLVKEPLVRRNVVAERIHSELLSARGKGKRLRVVVGQLRDPHSSRELAAAQRSGVDVQVRVRELGHEDEQILRAAGVRYQVRVERVDNLDHAYALVRWRKRGVDVAARHERPFDPEVERVLRAGGVPIERRPYQHLNYIGLQTAESERAYVGSHELWHVQRTRFEGRELGVMIDGRNAANVRTLVEQLTS